MKDELWKQVSQLFQSALKLDGHERSAYLANACGENESLRRQVESLLCAHDGAGEAGFIEGQAFEFDARLMAENEAQAGDVIDRYKILKLLGAGGMGEVYLADDPTLKRPVAIKVLPAETAQDRDRVRRFAQEARAASALNHPNIITVYQVGDFKNSRFIATEFIKGRTLRDKLGEGPLALTQSLDIAIQVVAALEAAHHAGIIHRDIKPENIMVRDDGFIKVLDFGLAKLSGQNAETEELLPAGPESETRDPLHTRPGTIMGTAAYMSPEQARGLSVDDRTDIWSVGVLIYEMFAGRQPFGGETATDTIAAILKTEPEPILDIPVELERIIAKALAKNPDERYQVIKDLLTDLREFKQELEFNAKLEKNGNLHVATRDNLTVATQIQPGATVSNAEFITSRIRSHKFAAAGSLLLVVLAVSVIYYLTTSTAAEPKASKSVIESIAVLPFAYATGNAEIEYLSDGMTDSLINSLSQFADLTVKARSSVFQYKGKEVPPQTVGTELAVQAILLGRVTQLNDVLTLSLELVDTNSGDRIWGEIYDRKLSDIASLQSEITRDVASRLGSRLSAGNEQRAAKADTADPEAFRFYLQGLYHLNKRNAEDIRKSIDLLERATEKDPTFAKAYAALASAYITLRPYNAGLSADEIKQLAVKAQSAVSRAKELDDSLPEVHGILGTYSDVQWKFAAAEEEYKRALQLNPNDASIRLSYSLNLSIRGRHEEAIAQINRALELDPFSVSIAFNLGARYQEARRFDDAIAQFKRVLEMEPKHALTHFILAYTYEAVGRYAEAISEHRAADILLERTTADVADVKSRALKNALRTSGEKGYWRKRLELSKQEYARGKRSAYEIAIVFARLGERDSAIEQLERSFADREFYIPWIRTQSAFDAINDDPRFIDLIQRLGLY